MRVIAGSAKGTRLYGPGSYRVRPMLDRVKESLFDMLGEEVQSADVLDLYAGVGSLGIEALSRGAEHADFFEKNRATAEAIRSNLQRAHLEEKGRVYPSRLPGGLKLVRGPYGLIFIDPPFRIEKRFLEELFRRIGERRLLDREGFLIYRHSPRGEYQPPSDEWFLAERRDYGDSIISIYKGQS